MDLKEFDRLPVMGIIRGLREQDVNPLVESILHSGLKTIEVAMNTPSAARVLSSAVRFSGGRLCVGAGTVLTLDTLKLAIDCGATFIVMPVLIGDVMDYCVKRKIPVFPGALTPDEIYKAWMMGATMVKVFPARFFGPAYLTEIKGPFQDVKLLACGGVNKDNIKSFFSSGADAVAFGGSIFRKDWVENGEFFSIERAIKGLLESIK